MFKASFTNTLSHYRTFIMELVPYNFCLSVLPWKMMMLIFSTCLWRNLIFLTTQQWLSGTAC